MMNMSRIMSFAGLVVAGLMGASCTASDEAAQSSSQDVEVVQSEEQRSGLRVGAKLYDMNGELWGTVVEMSDAHTFPNGVTEPGVKVDYGARMGNPPVPPQWLPQRSAERFRVE
jgi:hypothetical protein